MAQELRFSAAKSALYYDKKRNKDITLKEGDKVYLSRRNVKTIRLNSKFNYIKIGPFKILRSIKGISFKLDLLDAIRIHPVFHVFLFELANNATPAAIVQPEYIDS